MSCASQNNSCSCNNHSCAGSALWSTNKKIRILEKCLENIEEKKKDVQEALTELKTKK